MNNLIKFTDDKPDCKAMCLPSSRQPWQCIDLASKACFPYADYKSICLPGTSECKDPSVPKYECTTRCDPTSGKPWQCINPTTNVCYPYQVPA